MQNGTRSSLLSDWLSISLRWLTLLGITLSLAFVGELTIVVAVPLLVASVWNLWLTAWATLKRRRFAPRSLTVIVDMLVAYTLFYLSGTSSGGLGWAGLLPLMSAALFFGWMGVLVVTLANLVVQGGLVYLSYDLISVLIFLAIMLPLYIIAGLVFGFIGQRIKDLIQRDERALSRSRNEAQRAERERSRSIYALVSALSSSLNYERVLETALDMSASAIGRMAPNADRMVSGVLLFTNDEIGSPQLRVGSARGFTQADMRITLPGRQGLISQTIEDGSAQLAIDVANDPELSRIVAFRACQAAYCVPLRLGLDNYGVLLFGHPNENYFTPECTEVLDIVGNQAVIAIQNARLYRDLELEKERILEIQEEARNKLARDLHDGPTQSVSAIAMRVNFARRLLERDVKATADELFRVEDLARQTAKEIRHMLFTLRPLVLESQGLVAALESMAEKMRETYNQNVIISADPQVVSQLEMNKQGVIFYIAEEAVNNARKHAQAENVWVRVRPLEDELALLEIEDDGMGFDKYAVEDKYEDRGSLGMVNMRERTELVNGRLQIDSEMGQGTFISVIIPLTEDAVERMRRGL